MYRSHPEHILRARFVRVRRSSIRTGDRTRGFTLAELLISATIMAILAVVVSGLVMAVQTSWRFTKGMEEADAQARAALDRIQYMIGQAGVYQLPGRPTRLGLAVVSHQWFFANLPDVLVVWSGGRNAGMAAAGIQNRLPQIKELVILACDPQNASRLLEITVPGDTSLIDFDDPGFSKKILSLIASPKADPALLCDQIRPTSLPRVGRYRAKTFGSIRFELVKTPGDIELQSVAPGTPQWKDLTWPQGIVSSDSGLRQETVRIELQIRKDADQTTSRPTANDVIPFFGSASYRYVYQPS